MAVLSLSSSHNPVKWSSSRRCLYAHRQWRNGRQPHDGFLRVGEPFAVVYVSVRRLVSGIGQLRVHGRGYDRKTITDLREFHGHHRGQLRKGPKMGSVIHRCRIGLGPHAIVAGPRSRAVNQTQYQAPPGLMMRIASFNIASGWSTNSRVTCISPASKEADVQGRWVRSPRTHSTRPDDILLLRALANIDSHSSTPTTAHRASAIQRA